MSIYTVRPGDTLTGIAAKLNLCDPSSGWSPCVDAANKLAAANSILDPSLIYPGQVLTVPDPADAAPPLVLAPTQVRSAALVLTGAAGSSGLTGTQQKAFLVIGAFGLGYLALRDGKKARRSTKKRTSKRRGRRT